MYKYRGTNANAGASHMRFTYSGNGAEQAPTIVVKGDVVVGELAEDGSATISAGVCSLEAMGTLQLRGELP